MKLFAMLSSSALVSADVWSDCSSAAAHLKGRNLTITPDPPTLGPDLKLVMTGTLDEVLTSGSINVWFKDEGFTVVNKTYDVCEAAAKSGHPCPFPTGAFNFAVPDLPTTGVPGGDYTGQAYFTDQSSQQVMCAAFDFHL
jgi:hypothetical protein